MLKRVLSWRVPLPLAGALIVFVSLGAVAVMFSELRSGPLLFGAPAEETSAAVLPVLAPTASWLKGADLAAEKDRMIRNGELFIEANLSEMTLRVWASGTMAKEVPILTKGREGSWWETPAGLYKIESKARSHFSSFGKVYQPWSMAFQGNFFIHGWPYYPDGTDVASTYSGGCIRLSTADAKQVYALVKEGTPVLILEKDFESDTFSYAAREVSPPVGAAAYLAADLKNRFIFAEKDRGLTLPIASITKLMTALVAAEYINLDSELTVPQGAIIYTSVPRLATGEKHSAYQLLYPLLQESSNEAALTFASALGRDRFVELMNQKAAALGMSRTRFEDPAGMEPGNVSTAEDLFILAQYLLNNRSFILRITSGTLGENVYGPSEFEDLKNLNVFVGEPDFVGGKVGQTLEAQQTMLAIFNESLGGAERQVAVVVLASPRNGEDARAIRDAVLAAYR